MSERRATGPGWPLSGSGAALGGTLTAALLCAVAVAVSPSVALAAAPSGHTDLNDPGLLRQLRTGAKRALAHPSPVSAGRHATDAHADLNRSKSADVFRAHGGQDEATEPWAPLTGVRRPSFVSPTQASAVDARTGKREIATSSSPLWVGSGAASQPVDLHLRRGDTGAAFEPESSPTPVSVPADTDGWVTFGRSQLRLRLAGAEHSTAALIDGRAFYANVLTDTDLIVNADRQGVETFTQLRSAASPERQTYHLDLPAGATLRSDGHGGAQIVRGGDVIGSVLAPAGEDATGKQIPVRLEIDGSDVSTVVDHRDMAVTYPLLIDPVVNDYSTSSTAWLYLDHPDLRAWFSSNPSGSNPFRLAKSDAEAPNALTGWAKFLRGSGATTYGLFAYNAPVGATASPGQAANWGYDIPHGLPGNTDPCSNTSRITRVDFDYIGFNYGGSNHSSVFMNMGLLSARNGVILDGQKAVSFTDEVTYPFSQPPGYTVAPDDGSVSTDQATQQCTKTAFWGLFANPFVPVAVNGQANGYLGGVVIWTTDPDAPSKPAMNWKTPPPAGWVKQATMTAQPSASDNGLGVARIGITGTNVGTGAADAATRFSPYGYLTNYTAQCGDRVGNIADKVGNLCPDPPTQVRCGDRLGNFCPTTLDGSVSRYPVLSVNSDPGFGEGVSYLRPLAEDQLAAQTSDDPTGHFTYGDATPVYIDRSGPSVALSGALADGRAAFDPGRYSLSVAATDGQSTTNAARRSGVGSLKAVLTGPASGGTAGPSRTLGTGTTSCPASQDSCPLNLDLTADLVGYTPGTYTLTVTAQDRVAPTPNQTDVTRSFVINPEQTPANAIVEDWISPNPNQPSDWAADSNLDFGGWTHVDTSSTGLLGSATFSSNEQTPHGLKVSTPLVSFPEGWTEWQWTAPGDSTIYRADYEQPVANGAGCVVEGLRSKPNTDFQTQYNAAPGAQPVASKRPTVCGAGLNLNDSNNPIPADLKPNVQAAVLAGNPGAQRFCQNADCTSTETGAQDGNTAVFGLQRRVLTAAFDASQPGVKVYLADHHAPTIEPSSNSLSGGWVNGQDNTASGGSDTTRAHVLASATDGGLGVSRLDFQLDTRQPGQSFDPGAASSSTLLGAETSACTGHRNTPSAPAARCPGTASGAPARDLTADRSIKVSDLPDGIDTIGFQATDIVGNKSLGSDDTGAATTGPAFNYSALAPLRVDTVRPSIVAASGPLYDANWANGVATNANGAVAVTVGGQDALSGMKHFDIDEVGSAGSPSRLLGSADETCDQRDATCRNDSLSTTVNAANLAEGAHTLLVRGSDAADNHQDSSPWTVFVDRTRPGQASDLSAWKDTESGHTMISWDPAPDLAADGVSSGSGSVAYQYTLRSGGAVVSSSSRLDGLIVDAGTIPKGATVDMTLAAIDAAGNVGDPVTLSDTVTDQVWSTDNVGDGTDATQDTDPSAFSVEPDANPLGPYPNETQNGPTATSSTARTSTRSGGATQLCSSNANPCGTFNGQAAAAYASRWSLNRLPDDAVTAAKANPNYYYFIGDDCTNFISQALKAGGMRFMGTRNGANNPNLVNGGGDINDYLHSIDGNWWSVKTVVHDGRGGGSSIHDNTNSWSAVRDLYNHLVNYHLVVHVPTQSAVREGDLIFYEQHDHGDPVDGHNVDHVQIVTQGSENKHSIRVAQHSHNYEHSLDKVFANKKPSIRGQDYNISAYRVVAAQANVGG